MRFLTIFIALLAICLVQGKVHVLNDDNFMNFINSNPHILLKLYAPWCGHCKKMAPEFIEAAKIAEEEKAPYVLAEIDCDKNTKAATYFNVTMFPTMKIVKNKEISAYTGERKTMKFLEAMDASAGLPPKKRAHRLPPVVNITDTNYKDFYADYPIILLKIYAPWCGHCKALAPEFEKAGEYAKAKMRPYIFAQYDGTTNRALMQAYNITSYPTLKVIKQGADSDFVSDRNAAALIAAMDKEAGLPVDEEAKKLVQKAPEVTLAETKDAVVTLGDNNYTAFFQKNKNVLVKIYAPWCGHCKALAPNYIKAAQYAKDHNKPYIFAEIDGTVNKQAMVKFNVSGYPTLKFIQGDKETEYTGGRETVDLLKFMDSKTGVTSNYDELNAKKAEPLPSKHADALVATLDNDNFMQYIEKNWNKPILLKLYATWCQHCQRMAPEFEKAAMQSRESKKPYLFAEINVPENRKAHDFYNVTSYPTIKLIYLNKTESYEGERTAGEFLKYMDRKAGITLNELKTETDVRKFLAFKNNRAILISDSPAEIAEFKNIGTDVLELAYYQTSVELGKKVFTKLTKTPAVIIINAIDEAEKYWYPSFDKNEFEEFLTKHENPTVLNQFSHRIIADIISTDAKKTGVILFRKTASQESDTLDRAFRKAAMKFKNDKYIIGITDITGNGIEDKLASFFDIKDKDLPRIEIISGKGELQRFVMKDKITEENILKFVKDYEAEKVERFLRSEEIPKENKGPVLKLVTKNFVENVIHSSEDVVVTFYTENDKENEEWLKIFEQAANNLKKNQKLKFGTVNADKNDIPGHFAKKYPVIKLFPGKDKTNPKVFEDTKNLEKLIEFIKKNTSFPVEETK